MLSVNFFCYKKREIRPVSKESQTAEHNTSNKKLLRTLMPVIMGVIVSVTLVFVIQKNYLFSSVTPSVEQTAEISKTIPLQNLHADSNPKIEIVTDIGPIIIELYPEYATDIVKELVELSQSGYYNDSTVIESMPPFGFVIAKIGPSAKSFSFTPIENKLSSVRGSVAISKLTMPKAYLNNLFIGYQPHGKIQDQYIIIGQVLDGLDIVERSESGVRFKIKSFKIRQKV